MAIDVSRQIENLILPPEVSADIWQETQQASAVMAVARRIELPGRGLNFQTITGDVEAEWVMETDEKPIDRPSLGTKAMTPYTIAVIVPFSNQFRRDAARLYSELVARIPASLAKKFDETVFAAANPPGEAFDQLGTATALEVSDPATYEEAADLVADLAKVDVDPTHILSTANLHARFLTSTNVLGNPYFIANPATGRNVGSVFGVPVYKTRGVLPNGTIGMIGDFSKAMYGVVEGVSIDITDKATLTETVDLGDGPETRVLNLWQRNMFAVRAEIELGFIHRGTENFRRITAKG